jgi:NAD(P)-dependent dehydrogenase (short-subunit alcohol dehydrogenase family)
MSNKVVVITGSTRGIGFGLADAFLGKGCSVVVSGRSQDGINTAIARLQSKYKTADVFGVPCEVSQPEQMQELWDKSVQQFGRVDIWVNNAGWSGDEGMAWERPSDELASIIETNILGTVYGSQTAMQGMLKQGSGAIYNMEGMGADGRKHAGLTTYGTSKYAIHYFTESFALEAKGSPVIIGALRPGMVVTDMIVDRYKDRPADWERAKKIFNIIADTVENVTPWLVDQMIQNQKSGAILSYSSSLKLMWRFMTSRFSKRDLFTN